MRLNQTSRKRYELLYIADLSALRTIRIRLAKAIFRGPMGELTVQKRAYDPKIINSFCWRLMQGITIDIRAIFNALTIIVKNSSE